MICNISNYESWYISAFRLNLHYSIVCGKQKVMSHYSKCRILTIGHSFSKMFYVWM